MKPSVSVALPPSGLTTITLRGPASRSGDRERAVMLVGEPTLVALTLVPAPKLTVAPAWKLLPVSVTPSV